MDPIKYESNGVITNYEHKCRKYPYFVPDISHHVCMQICYDILTNLINDMQKHDIKGHKYVETSRNKIIEFLQIIDRLPMIRNRISYLVDTISINLKWACKSKIFYEITGNNPQPLKHYITLVGFMSDVIEHYLHEVYKIYVFSTY